LYRLLLPAILLALMAGAVLADRALTDDERAKLVAALQAAGCSGGKMGFDDGKSRPTTPSAPTARPAISTSTLRSS
jgi:hypothetical protein